jgi:hypothetical protein
LVYKLDDSGKHGLVVFVRSGTHSALFSSFDNCGLVAVLPSSCKAVSQSEFDRLFPDCPCFALQVPAEIGQTIASLNLALSVLGDTTKQKSLPIISLSAAGQSMHN